MKKILITLSIFLSVLTGFAQQTIELNNWKFKTGDSLEWSRPGYNDTDWKPIKVGERFETQGYDGYDGYVWYRIRFSLPSGLKGNAFSDALRFALGKIDDGDQTFLNGIPLGQNGKLSPAGNVPVLNNLYQAGGACDVARNYTVPISDPRLLWDQENVLAIRVFDGGGGGGMYTLPVNIRMQDLTEYLSFDIGTEMTENPTNGTISKTIILKTLSPLLKISGKLNVEITNNENKQTVASQVFNVCLKKEENAFALNFKGDLSQRLKTTCTFTESKTKGQVGYARDLPYILTPKPAETPRINGAKVLGAGPGHPFLFRVPATGARPMFFSAENLPEGLKLDVNSGIITGIIKKAGEYTVILKAKNAKGETTRNLKIVVGDRLALTPPMGWNSWNAFSFNPDEEKVKAMADAMFETGLIDHGWAYINIDTGWGAEERDKDGHIMPNEKFKDLKSLTDYIHSYGLKAGIYSSPGDHVCGPGLGSYQHEEQDAQTFANWGFDYLKYDLCSYRGIYNGHDLSEVQKPYKIMKAALDKTNRDVVFSLCQYGEESVWQWGGSVGANLWRTVGDISDTWGGVCQGFFQEPGAPYAKPGNWNDPDIMVIGHGWFGGSEMHPSRLTPDEQYSHISLWSLLASPLLMGCDLTKLDGFTLNLLTNDEVIDIDQDPLGKQALPAVKNDNYIVMVKDLEDGSKAVGLFNLTSNNMKIAVTWDALKLTGRQTVRDVWRQKDLGVFSDKFESVVPGHGVVLVKLIPDI